MLAVAIVACVVSAAAGWAIFARSATRDAAPTGARASEGPYRTSGASNASGAEPWETGRELPLASARWKSLESSAPGGGAAVRGGVDALAAAIASALATISCPTCSHRFVVTDGARTARP